MTTSLANLRKKKTSDWSITGKLKILLLRGDDLRKVQMLGIQDPFVQVEFGGQKKKTRTETDGDTCPIWADAVEFECKGVSSPNVKMTVINENRGIDQTIGTLEIPMFVLSSANSSIWLPIFKTGGNKVKAGKILVQTTFEGTGSIPPPIPSKYGLVSAVYGTEDVSVDVQGLLESQVAGLKLKFDKELDLSEYFGFDPLNNHVSNKMLTVLYQKGGDTKKAVVGERHEDTVIEFDDLALDTAKAEKALMEQRSKEADARAKALTVQKEEADKRAAVEAKRHEEAEKRAQAAEEEKLAAEKRADEEMQETMKHIEANKDLTESLQNLKKLVKNMRSKMTALRDEKRCLRARCKNLKGERDSLKKVVKQQQREMSRQRRQPRSILNIGSLFA